MAELKRERYLVSMLGEDANWVRNVRAAGGRVVLRRRRRSEVRLVEVPAEERAPILRRYLPVARGTRPHIPVDRHASLEEFERIARDYPVFRIDRAAQGSERAPRPAGGAPLEVTAHMRVRPGQLDGFVAQAAECVRLTQENDTLTLRYDWYLSTDGTRCEVRETYASAEGLVEHRANVGPALERLFAWYADHHTMIVCDDPDPKLLELADRSGMSDQVTWSPTWRASTPASYTLASR